MTPEPTCSKCFWFAWGGKTKLGECCKSLPEPSYKDGVYYDYPKRRPSEVCDGFSSVINPRRRKE